MSAAFIVLFAVAACELDSTAPVTRNTPNAFDLRATWVASVTPLGTGTIRGTLNARDYAAYYETEMSISGGVAARTYNWRIFLGTCAAPVNTVAGNSTQAFAPLVTGGVGSAAVTRLMPSALYLVDSRTYNVRVLTGTALSTTVACGDLRRS